jgi:hypothetical protein
MSGWTQRMPQSAAAAHLFGRGPGHRCMCLVGCSFPQQPKHSFELHAPAAALCRCCALPLSACPRLSQTALHLPHQDGSTPLLLPLALSLLPHPEQVCLLIMDATCMRFLLLLGCYWLVDPPISMAGDISMAGGRAGECGEWATHGDTSSALSLGYVDVGLK